MKQKKTALHFAQQLEEFQTNRKAKEVNEIYKFDSLKEGLKQRKMTVDRRMEKLRLKSLRGRFDPLELIEERIIQDKAQTLQDVAEFEQQAYDLQIDAPDNEFDIIAELQGFRYPRPQAHQALKQLPEASADAFAHELNEFTERELQKELEQNEKTLQDSLKKPGRLELANELASKESEQSTETAERKEPGNVGSELLQNTQQAESLLEEPSAEESSLLTTSGDDSSEKDVVQNQKTSGSSLIYFRSSPPPSGKDE